MARAARLAQVIDADTLGRAVRAVPARQIGEAAVHEDVACVAAARIRVTERTDPVRTGRCERDDDGAEGAEEEPHD